MSDYSLEQAKIDIARLQNEIGQYKRVLKVFPNLLDIRGDVKLSGTSTGFTPTQLDANGTILGIGAIADGESLARIGTEVIGLNGGWIPAGETWTYASSTTVTISGDKTNKYSKGMKVKLTQTSVKYFYITAVSYSSPNTTLTLTAGIDFTVANATITNPFYSMVANPVGFPHKFNYNPVARGSTGSAGSYSQSTNIATFSISNTNIHLTVVVKITDKGSWSDVVLFDIPVVSAGILYGFEGVIALGGVIRKAIPIFSIAYSNEIQFRTGIGVSVLLWSNINVNDTIILNTSYPF